MTLAAEPFTIAVRHGMGPTVIALRGDLHAETAPSLEATLVDLIDTGYADLVLDLSAIGFLDTFGLGAVVAAHNHLGTQGRLRLQSVPDEARRVLELAGLDRLFPTI